MYKLFIVEDDAGIARAVAGLAEKWGLEACVCGDLSRVAEEFAGSAPVLARYKAGDGGAKWKLDTASGDITITGR